MRTWSEGVSSSWYGLHSILSGLVFILSPSTFFSVFCLCSERNRETNWFTDLGCKFWLDKSEPDTEGKHLVPGCYLVDKALRSLPNPSRTVWCGVIPCVYLWDIWASRTLKCGSFESYILWTIYWDEELLNATMSSLWLRWLHWIPVSPVLIWKRPGAHCRYYIGRINSKYSAGTSRLWQILL